MNSGSLLSFQDSCRCGCSPNARQIRDTADCDRPRSAANERVDQCVASVGVVSNVRVITASTCSSETVRGRPGRGSSSNPSSRLATNRERHLRALLTSISSWAAIAVFPSPSAAASTIRERIANAFALFARRDQATNCDRSSSVNSTTAAKGLGTCQHYTAKNELLTHDTSPTTPHLGRSPQWPSK